MGKTIDFKSAKQKRDLARASKSLLETMGWYYEALLQVFKPVTKREKEVMFCRWSQNDMNLTSTRHWVELWNEFLLNPRFASCVSDTEELIRNQAKREWGNSTEVEFLRGSGTVKVKNLGRQVTIDEFSFIKCFESDNGPEGA